MKLNTSIRKRFRVSNKVKKVASKDRFRLCISRSAKNISAQIIDDIKKVTLLSASSVEKDIRSGDKVNKTELSKIVAAKLAKKAQEKKITKIYFDRGVYRYHGSKYFNSAMIFVNTSVKIDFCYFFFYCFFC